MGIFDMFSGWLGDPSDPLFADDFVSSSAFDDDFGAGPSVNPASGLPMMDGAMIDVGGSPYGTDLSDDGPGSSACDDSFSSGVDDSFNSGFDDW